MFPIEDVPIIYARASEIFSVGNVLIVRCLIRASATYIPPIYHSWIKIVIYPWTISKKKKLWVIFIDKILIKLVTNKEILKMKKNNFKLEI